jgi:hypothetical protein
MSQKEKVRTILPGIEVLDLVNPVYAEPYSEEGAELGINPEQFDDRIAKSLELPIQQITQSSLGRWLAKIRNIEFNDFGLLVSVEVPFVISSSRRDEIRLQKGFAKYPSKRDNQKLLSNRFFYPMLVAYLIEAFGIRTVNPRIRSRLKKIPQRTLAGRPTEPISSDMQARIRQEGKAIREMLTGIRRQVQEWQKRTDGLSDLAIQQ